MIWNKKGFLSFFFVALIIFNQGCDESIFSENVPTVSLDLVSLNHIHEGLSTPVEPEQVQYGDSISITLALMVEDMESIFDMSFQLEFDQEYFQWDDEDYAFTDDNFFAQSAESFLDTGTDQLYDYQEEGFDFDTNPDPAGDNWDDLNGNQVWDEGEGTELNFQYDIGEPYTSSNNNNIWDTFFPPIGLFELHSEGSSIIEGFVGAPAPATNSVLWGSGVVCYLYFSGIMSPAYFDLTITEANDYLDGTAVPVSLYFWETFDYSLTSPTIPSLQIMGSTVTDDKITVSVYIEDSSPLSYLTANFEFDPEHLAYYSYNFGGFFSDPLYDLNAGSSEGSGVMNFTYIIDGIDELNPFTEIDLDPSSLSEGSGHIINIVFTILDPQIESTSIDFNLIQALGYNLFLGAPISLNTQYWEFEQGIELDLMNLSAIDG